MLKIRKIAKYLSSMQFAIILLGVLAIACSAGSFVTQGKTIEWYAAQYSERTAAVIVALHLDDAFHSWWFVLISAFLCCNLFLCNLIHLPQVMRRAAAAKDPAGVRDAAADVSVHDIEDPKAFFARLHMPQPVAAGADGAREILFSSKNAAGYWGAWICHLGIILLIAGFSLGQYLHKEYAVYGVPGQSKPIEDTGYALEIDDFRVGLREDDTVEQYTADITVYDLNSGASESAEISVNHPAKLFGMKFYQNSTGWAADVIIMKSGEFLQKETLCAGEYVPVKDKPDLVVYFNAFYPDFVMEPGAGPKTVSGQLNNPAYLYTVYYQGQVLGMNVLMGDEPLTIDEYTVRFSAPQSYTMIQVKADRFTPLAFAGGMIVLLGLILAFYVLPRRIWAVREENGLWTVYGACPKGRVLFEESFRQAAEIRENGRNDNSEEKERMS